MKHIILPATLASLLLAACSQHYEPLYESTTGLQPGMPGARKIYLLITFVQQLILEYNKLVQ